MAVWIIIASFNNDVFGFAQKLPPFVLGQPAVEIFCVLLPWSVEPKKYDRGSMDYNPSLQ